MIALLRSLLAVGLISVLFYLDLIDLRAIGRIVESPGGCAAVIGLLLLTYPLSAMRWHRILASQGFRVPLVKVVQITFIGQFFNNFMPGSYGGDAIRLGYVYKAARQGLSRIIFSLFVDRLSGLVGLLTLGLVAVLLFHRVGETVLVIGMALVVLGLGLGVWLAVLLAPHVLRLLRPLQGRLFAKLFSFVRETTGALELYLRSPGVLIFAWIVSVVQFVLILASLVIVAETLQIGTLGWLDQLIAGTWSLITNAVPITPGGIGLGEAAYERFARLLEEVPSAAPYATVFLAYRALTIVVSLPGALLFLIYRHEMVEYVHRRADA